LIDIRKNFKEGVFFYKKHYKRLFYNKILENLDLEGKTID